MAKSLRDYAEALRDRSGEPDPYTHEVLTPDGRSFSIHKSEAAATERAAQIKGSVRPYVAKPSHYWDSTELGARYDH